MSKKRDLRRDLPCNALRLLCSSQSCIIRVAANLPEVSFHGLFATGGVLLREEVGDVGRLLHQVFAAGFDRSYHRSEASASCELFRSRYRRALVLTYQVDAGTIRILGSGGA